MTSLRVAVVGASSDRRKFGNKAVRAYRDSGHAVYPINPNETTIEGLPAYRSLSDVPHPIDIVSMYVPPAVGMKLLPEIAEREPQELWLNPGSESDELIDAAADLKLRTVVACSILALGLQPEAFSDI
jgi:predicted CoA-binding protein